MLYKIKLIIMKKLMIVLATMLAMGIQVGYSNESREFKGTETAIEQEEAIEYIVQACPEYGDCIRFRIREVENGFWGVKYEVVAYFANGQWHKPYLVSVNTDRDGNLVSIFMGGTFYYL